VVSLYEDKDCATGFILSPFYVTSAKASGLPNPTHCSSILAISAATVNLPRPVHVSASLTFLEVADKADHRDYII
jgi:hypothetical protein